MQLWRAILVACAIDASSVATAGTIASIADYSGSADAGALLTGATFNPSLGTLTGVDLAITGLYNPDLLFPLLQTNIPTESQLDYSMFGLTGSFGTYNLNLRPSPYGNELTGPAEQFAIKVDPTDLRDYVSFGGNQNRGLGYINLFSVAAAGNWGGAFSDDSLYSGQAVITYTYTPIPEPSTLKIIGGGLLLLAIGRLHRYGGLIRT